MCVCGVGRMRVCECCGNTGTIPVADGTTTSEAIGGTS